MAVVVLAVVVLDAVLFAVAAFLDAVVVCAVAVVVLALALGAVVFLAVASAMPTGVTISLEGRPVTMLMVSCPPASTEVCTGGSPEGWLSVNGPASRLARR